METNTVPKTRIQGGMFLRLEGNETEPIGNRIIESPENTEHTEILRNPRSGFVAYAPVGSIKRGQGLVTTGGSGRTVACATCHGADLRGLGPVRSGDEYREYRVFGSLVLEVGPKTDACCGIY